MADPRDIANRILRNAGASASEAAEAVRAQANLDRKLVGLGLAPTPRPPVKVRPGEEVGGRREEVGGEVREAGGMPAPIAGISSAASAILRGPVDPRAIRRRLRRGPKFSEGDFTVFDAISATAVSSLATTAAGGTEVRFNVRGFAHVGSGAIGVYYNRSLGAAQNFKWLPMAPGILIPFHPVNGLFIGTNNVGGITVGGVLNLSFYRLPEYRRGQDDPREKPTSERTPGDEAGDPGVLDAGGSGRGEGFNYEAAFGEAYREALAARLGAAGSDFPAGAAASGASGTDVTLGTFSDAGVGTQIYLGGSNMPVGGASVQGHAILNGPPDNTDAVWVGETAALAVARNGGLNAAGQDTWAIPVGGKLFMLANSGTQRLGVRYRS